MYSHTPGGKSSAGFSPRRILARISVATTGMVGTSFEKREAFVGNAARLRPARIDQNLEAVQNLPGPVPASELSDNVRADQQGEPARRIFRLQYIERAQCQRRLGQRELDVADGHALSERRRADGYPSHLQPVSLRSEL